MKNDARVRRELRLAQERVCRGWHHSVVWDHMSQVANDLTKSVDERVAMLRRFKTVPRERKGEAHFK